MRKSHLYILLSVSLIIIGVLILALSYQSFKVYTQDNFIESLRGIEIGSDIKLLETEIGKAVYTTTDPDWDNLDWYKKNFSVDIKDDEDCYIFHPPGAWPNQLIVVITDKNGKIKWVTPRDT